jgi:hypothetical protein
MRALGDLDDAAFGAAIRALVLDSRQNAIAVHRVLDRIRRNEKVAFDLRDRLVGHNEAVTIAMSYQTAGDQVRVGNALCLGGVQWLAPSGHLITLAIRFTGYLF